LTPTFSDSNITHAVRHRRPNIYAVIESGGKQYRVVPGQVIKVDLLEAEKGSQVELDRVLLIADDEKVTVGQPLVAGARVVAESLGDERGKKIIVFKYKPKTRYRRKKGHRQTHTRLAIKEITLGQGS
jgi:large subunit ribosomal protein L21